MTWAYSAHGEGGAKAGAGQGVAARSSCPYASEKNPTASDAPCPSSLKVSSRFMSPSALPRRRFLPPCAPVGNAQRERRHGRPVWVGAERASFSNGSELTFPLFFTMLLRAKERVGERER